MALIVTAHCLVCDVCGEEIAVPRRATRDGEALLLFAEATAISHNRTHSQQKRKKPNSSRWSELLRPFRDELKHIA